MLLPTSLFKTSVTIYISKYIKNLLLLLLFFCFNFPFCFIDPLLGTFELIGDNFFCLCVLDNSLNKVLDSFVSKFQNSHKARPIRHCCSMFMSPGIANKNIAKSKQYGIKLVQIVINSD